MGLLNSRKAGVAFLSAITLAIAAFLVSLFFSGKKEPESATRNRLFYPQVINRESADLDTDKDGLKDWEEILYGTDAKNPDTDADGTSDGEEVRVARDPNRRGELLSDGGWSDVLKPADLQSGVPEEAETKENLTRTVFESLVPLYLARQQSGVPFDPQAIAREMLASLGTGSLTEQIKYPDFKIIERAGQPEVKFYLNRLAQISEKYLLNWDQDPLALFASILQGGEFDPVQLSRFDIYVARTESALKEFADISVPSSWELEHRELFKSVQTLNISLEALRQSDQDTLLAVTKIQSYVLAVESLQKLVSGVKQRLKTEKLAFGKEEPFTRLLALTP